MKCPFCHQIVSNGRFCSNCSKPLNPKWYQKNSLASIIIMFISIIFLICCVYLFFFSNRSNDLKPNMSAEDYYNKATEAFEKGNIREMQICLGQLKQVYPEENIQAFFDEKISSLPFIQASDLIKKYEENSVSTNLQYSGKLLRISGIVTNIGEDITKTVYIKLGNEEASFYDIRCEFVYEEEISQVATLKKGDVVTILGLYEDYASMNPGLKNSYIDDKSLLK